jgi:hypothetical protein
LTSPNGGESLSRGLPYFVTFEDNLAERVSIELLKGEQTVAVLSTNAPSDRAFRWEVPTSLAPGSDYSIRIRSVATAGLVDRSDRPFTIGAPRFETTRRLSDGAIGLQWSGASSNVFVEFKGSLSEALWSTVAGPLQGTNQTYLPGPESGSGFFRLRVVP